MKQKNIIILLIAIIIILLGIIMIPKARISLKINSCLKNNGKWNYECDSCDTSIEKIKKPELEFMQIFFNYCFLYPSVITYNIQDSTILFQHNGTSILATKLPEKIDETKAYEIVQVYKPKTLYFKISQDKQSYLINSLFDNLKLIDFQDSIDYSYEDGGGNLLLFGYNNDSVKTVELYNYRTENQQKIILTLINECIKQETDSLTEKYLNRLQKYND